MAMVWNIWIYEIKKNLYNNELNILIAIDK